MGHIRTALISSCENERPEGCANLCDLACRRKTVEACKQRSVEMTLE